ncbi:cohesin domain-containing protein [Tumebacillus sp. BK434]|uniref:cohesin domain-containing protein n=1 Tax=Tumebacillus sp. BK434 TaxID=2512169 RepID=UPI00104F3A1C|nr:cohesin domain-containing protein [Tumebacillus sp. BK434]
MLGDPLDSPLQLDIDTTRATIYGGQLFETYVVSRNATSLAVEEATVAYDSNLYEFVSVTPQPGFQITSQDTSTPGQLRFSLTSPGAAFNTTGETKLLKLTFRAKEQAGAGRIETTAGSGTFTSGTQIVASLGSETITVNVKTADVNLDGSVTTADLAMAAYAHGGAPLAGYARADVNKDGTVDFADLNLISQALEPTPFLNGGTGYTLDLTQSGDVSASSSHPKTQYYLPYYAFDGDVTSNYYWNAGAYVNKGWLMYDFKIPQRIGKYSLMWQTLVGFESYMPKSWTFEGYDEAQGKWMVLDTQKDKTTWLTGVRQFFDFPNSNAYKQYRINISAANHSTYVGVGEMEMYGKLDSHPELGIESVADTVTAGTAFESYIVVTNGNAMHAEDAKVSYDSSLFEFVSAVPVATGTEIVRQDTATPGQLRLTLANTGSQNAVNAGQLVKLTFQAKPGATGTGNIEVQSGTAATATGAEIAPLTSGASITVQ